MVIGIALVLLAIVTWSVSLSMPLGHGLVMVFAGVLVFMIGSAALRDR